MTGGTGASLFFRRAFGYTFCNASVTIPRPDEREMRLVRYQHGGKVRLGRLEGEEVIELEGAFFIGSRPTPERVRLSEVRLLSPVVPSKVVCVGKNYAAHAAELGDEPPEEPCLFIKPESAVIGPEDEILYPAMSQQVDYEAELAVVIGRTLRQATPSEAREAALGYTCLNDVTARDLQRKDGQWTRSKSFDTFCPIGPWIETDVGDPDRLDIALYLNGERRQHANTSELIHKTADLVSFVSRVMTLRPGDVVATGTPAGVGPMRPGDVVEVRIERIGTLRNRVVESSRGTFIPEPRTGLGRRLRGGLE